MTIDKEQRRMISNKDFDQVVTEARHQGWRVDPTTKGFMFKAPNGTAKVAMDRLHKSSSPYALKQTVRLMQQVGGFRWPPEKR